MTIEERVQQGITLLDSRLPGWDEKIDLGRLLLWSGTMCILGQLHEPELDTVPPDLTEFGRSSDLNGSSPLTYRRLEVNGFDLGMRKLFKGDYYDNGVTHGFAIGHSSFTVYAGRITANEDYSLLQAEWVSRIEARRLMRAEAAKHTESQLELVTA